MNDFLEKIKKLNDTPDTTKDYDLVDIDENKNYALFSYLFLLILIPIFLAKDSKYAKYHVNQGLTLCIAEVVGGLLLGLLSRIPILGVLFIIIGSIFELVAVLLAVIGILNVLNDRAKELPVIGKIRFLK